MIPRAHVSDLPWRGICKRRTLYLQIWLAGNSEVEIKCLVEFLGENSVLPGWDMWGCCQAFENKVLQSWTVQSLSLPFIWAISALAEHEITERQQVLCGLWSVDGTYPCFCPCPVASSGAAWGCQGIDGRWLSQVLLCLLQVQSVNRCTDCGSAGMQELSWPHIRVGSTILRSFMSWSGCWQAEPLWEEQFLAGSYSNNKMRGKTSPRTSPEDHTNSGRLLASMGKKRDLITG